MPTIPQSPRKRVSDVRKGDVFSFLTVASDIFRVTPSNVFHVTCRCVCGTEKAIRVSNLIYGGSKSCGCMMRKSVSLANKKHGKFGTRVYGIWNGMLTRCFNQTDHAYANYGAKGITVCDRWRSFENFYADMGEPAEGMTLDRIDGGGNYCPENCRWATTKEQALNRKSTKFITFNGETLCLSDWGARIGMNRGAIARRLEKGWTLEAALTTPRTPRNKRGWLTRKKVSRES